MCRQMIRHENDTHLPLNYSNDTTCYDKNFTGTINETTENNLRSKGHSLNEQCSNLW